MVTLNVKIHNLYSNMLGMNVLNLRYIDLASLVQGHDEVEEVADLILELNTDNQAKEILEGQRRYREQMATFQALQKQVEDQKAALADKDDTIAALQAEIERLKNKKK